MTPRTIAKMSIEQVDPPREGQSYDRTRTLVEFEIDVDPAVAIPVYMNALEALTTAKAIAREG